jgi:HlyD family secretion protein
VTAPAATSGLPRAAWAAAAWLGCTLAGCDRPDPNRVQGYVEGEFVYVASAHAGRLEALEVRRGDQVKDGDPLFALDRNPELAARDEAERKLAQGRASWEDARKGKRPSEIEALAAQLEVTRAALDLSERTLKRHQAMSATDATSLQELDQARSTRDQDRQRVTQLEADLQTARLGARDDQVAAAEANARALEATLARAEWDLAQKNQRAPEGGLVFDTLYRPGEWVAAGRPVVVLLPPRNIKVRAFVPQGRIGAVRAGQPVRVTVDGAAAPYPGTVSFISPRAEYTPPVIFSQESRAKLVFLIEATFDPQVAANLHPGQPVDVELGP